MNMSKCKLHLYCLLVLILIFTGLYSKDIYADTNEPTRIINTIYDDSGSMIVTDSGNKCDTWCQAKYSMEVFAAMLGENDTMNIYVMSDFESTPDAKPILSLKGSSNNKQKNIDSIHNMLTPAAKSTIFTTVEKAYSDLLSKKADEKWLVVLTDGVFNNPSDMSSEDLEQYFSQKDPSVSVLFLGMGPEAMEIQSDESNDVYFEKAETSTDILSKLTLVSNRIFKSNKLEIDANTGNFQFDVPMSELMIFAQGEGVEISKVTDENGTELSGGSDTVSVMYSERACVNDSGRYANPIISTDLVGNLITYKGLFDAGTYTVNSKNAETIEVYYKPSVEIMAFLTDENGNVMSSQETVEPGDYTLSFSFVKIGTDERVAESNLLGNVTYTAHMSGSGADPNKEYKSGDKVSLSEGSYVINASADFPQFYTTVSTQLDMQVFWHRSLTIEPLEGNPTYEINKNKKEEIDGFVNAEIPTKFRLSFEGIDLNELQWDKVGVPEIMQVSSKDSRVLFDVKKSDAEIGIFEVNPSLKSGKTDILAEYDSIVIKLSVSTDTDGEAWNGETEYTVPIEDIRPWYWKHLDKVWKTAVGGLALFLFCGYLPFFKNYLPKTLKSKPYIKCIPSEPGEKRKDRSGVVTKNLTSTLLPYVSQKGTIKYVPKGVTGAPSLAVKAIKQRRMTITNIKALVNKDYITLDGESIKPDTKKFDTSAGVCIKVKKGEWTYVCSPNQDSK